MEITPKVIKPKPVVSSALAPRRRYTVDDDENILKAVKRCCGSTLPDTYIPWKRIIERLHKKGILRNASPDNLCDRYRKHLKPKLIRSKALSGNNNVDEVSTLDASEEMEAPIPCDTRNDSPPTPKSTTHGNLEKEPKKAWVISPLSKPSTSAASSDEKLELTVKIGPNLTVEDAWNKIRLNPENKKLTMSIFADFYGHALEIEGKPSQPVSIQIAIRYLVSLLDSPILGLKAISLSAMQFLKIMAK